MKCTKCGHDLTEGQKFCIFCGEPIKDIKQPVNTEGQNVCKKCGAPLKPGAGFCTKCGEPVKTGHENQKQLKQPKQNPVRLCKKCGAPLKPGVAFCTKCGEPVKTSQSQKKSGKAPLIITICVLAALLIAGGAFTTYYIYQKNNEAEKLAAIEEEQKILIDDEDDEDDEEVNIFDDEEFDIEEAEVDDRNSYIFPHSSTELITEDEMYELSVRDLDLARNEIFARNGRMFNTVDIQNYFNEKSWYNPTMTPSQFDKKVTLNSIERKNIDNMLRVEKARNGNAIYNWDRYH